MIHRKLISAITLISFTSLVSASSAVDNEVEDGLENKCIGTWQELQQAIDALPVGGNNGGSTPELLLCPTVLEIPHTIQILERSVRIGCATNTDDENTDSANECTLKRFEEDSSDESKTRLLEILGGITDYGHAANTVELSNIRLEGGEYYTDENDDDDDVDLRADDTKTSHGGAAILSQGANLILRACHFEENVASNGGGAIAVNDLGRPILLVITDTTFNENLSMEDDCHSLHWKQEHDRSTAELTTISRISSTTTTAASKQRHLMLQENAWLDQWDDPAQAAHAVKRYQARSGAVLCF